MLCMFCLLMVGEWCVDVYLGGAQDPSKHTHKPTTQNTHHPLQVIRAMKPSFLFWSPPANSPGFKGAAKELRARKQPYLAVVHMNEKPPRKTTVRSLHHFKVRTGCCWAGVGVNVDNCR